MFTAKLSFRFRVTELLVLRLILALRLLITGDLLNINLYACNIVYLRDFLLHDTITLSDSDSWVWLSFRCVLRVGSFGCLGRAGFR